MHAAISGRAEFLLPSTATLPDSARPPSILSDAMSPRAWSEPQIHDFVPELDPEAGVHLIAAAVDQTADVLGGGRAVVDDEIAVSRRHSRAPFHAPFQAGAIDQRPRGRRDSRRHAIGGGIGIL